MPDTDNLIPDKSVLTPFARKSLGKDTPAIPEKRNVITLEDVASFGNACDAGYLTVRFVGVAIADIELDVG